MPTGTVSFAVNQATASITVNVAGDIVLEADEGFTVTLSAPSNAAIGTAAASSTILNDDTVVTLRTIGNVGAYNRSVPNAWRDAWTSNGVFISHRQDGGNTSEAWLAANYSPGQPGIYGHSDISATGDIGVAGRTSGTQPTPQEIDGTEALRFVFTGTASLLDFTFASFDAGDRARVEAYDSGGGLITSQTTTTGLLTMSGVPGIASAIVRTEQGSFNIDKLSFG